MNLGTKNSLGFFWSNLKRATRSWLVEKYRGHVLVKAVTIMFILFWMVAIPQSIYDSYRSAARREADKIEDELYFQSLKNGNPEWRETNPEWEQYYRK